MDKDGRSMRWLLVFLAAVLVGSAAVSWWHPNPNAAADLDRQNALMLGTQAP